MTKIEKGQFGYLKHRKKISFLIMLIAIIVVFSVFLIGYFVTGKKENIMTVVAAVLALPTAKFAVSFFILIPHHSASINEHNNTFNKFNGVITLYDCVFSNQTSPIGTQIVVISDTAVIALSDEKSADKKLFEKSIKEFMERDNCFVNVTLYFDEGTFVSKAKLLSSNNSDDSKISNRMNKNKNSLLSMCL